jgi:hypothetical protein
MQLKKRTEEIESSLCQRGLTIAVGTAVCELKAVEMIV